jgi:hypothetical protein
MLWANLLPDEPIGRHLLEKLSGQVKPLLDKSKSG